MKSLIATLLLGSLCLFTGCKQEGCTNKEQFLDSFEVFLTDFTAAGESNTLEEAEKLKYENQYKQLVNDCYKKFREDLSLKERQDFWTNSLRFILDRFEGAENLNFKEEMNDPFNQYVKDELVSVVKDSGFSFLLSLQDVFKDDLPRLMETFSAEFEQISKGFLENLFKE